MTQKKTYIQNFWYVNNYGACLTAYALYRLLEENDYTPTLIDRSSDKEAITYKFTNFIKKYCNRTKTINSYIDSYDINNDKSVFITGSDQVFRPKFAQSHLSEFLLDFTNIYSKKIAFSASFGVSKEQFIAETDTKTIERMKHLLKGFDYISIREKAGVKICKELFDIDAEWIIDPVFMIDKSNYENISKNSNLDSTGKIVSYIFGKNKTNTKLFNHLKNTYNTDVIELLDIPMNIENWLNAIKNCKLLISNSFHGICFAIIFNKPFICLGKETEAPDRFDSLFELLGIENKCVNSINEIYEKDCIFNIDYEKVNKKIKQEAIRGIEFLRNSIEAQPSLTNEKMLSKIQSLEILLEKSEDERIKKTPLKNKLEKKIKKIKFKFFNIIVKLFYTLPKPIKYVIRQIRYRR